MPAGNVHYKYYMKGYWVEIPLTLSLVFVDWQLSLGNIVGYTFHRWCDNDWDLTIASEADGRALRELPIIGKFLFGISSTYAGFFRRYHRHWITHFPGISTLIRLCFVFITPLVFFDSWNINLIGNGWHKFWLGWWFGQSQADGIHYYLDLKYKE